MRTGDLEFRVLLDLYMTSEPWPLDNRSQIILEDFLDEQAFQHGYTDWVDAYHMHYSINDLTV